MTKQEATLLLAGCKQLADRLAILGVNMELDAVDRAALAWFEKVYNYDEGWWLDENEVRWAAGLSRSDIATLTFMLTKLDDNRL